MKSQSRTRTRSLATAALVALLVTTFGAAASPQPRDDQRQEHRKDRHEQRQERRQDRREDRKERHEDRKERRADRREDRRDDRQDRRDDRQRQRSSERYYRERLAQQRRVTQQRRLAQQRYYQQRHYRPATYRYGYGGHWYSTNHYGADMLRRAVSQGYQEGLRAGRAHRNDRWSRGYRGSRVWIDASYGYNSNYVRRSDYQHYFREGFERGYEDGYNGRYRYGRYDNGNDTAIILTTVLAAILGLQAIG
ncbi:MAG: hypothetical protein M3Y70_09760 [Pseudomonadota bacterium]|nr:hypothetical protein [Pseudomonadota bacterium]